MKGFQGEMIPYLAYSGIWVITSFVSLDCLFCTIILVINAIVFTYQNPLGGLILCLLQ